MGKRKRAAVSPLHSEPSSKVHKKESTPHTTKQEGSARKGAQQPLSITKTLSNQQDIHVKQLSCILKRNQVGLDSTETGLGKTRCAFAVAEQLDLKLFVCSPKSAMGAWYAEGEKLNALDRLLTVTNYEKIRNCQWFDTNKWYKSGMGNSWTTIPATPCPKLSKETIKVATKANPFGQRQVVYEWALPPRTLVVFDESHKTKNAGTTNFKILEQLCRQCRQSARNVYVLLLSATPFEGGNNVKPVLDILGLLPTLESSQYGNLFAIKDKQEFLKQVGRVLYDKTTGVASSLTRKQNDCDFAQTPIELDQHSHKVLNGHLVSLIKDCKQQVNKNKVSELIRIRQIVEWMKLPHYVKVIKQEFDAGRQVVVFVNFRESVDYLSDQFKKVPHVCVMGEQELEERTEAQRLFQSNLVRLMICTISSGSASISLHDTDGNYPRCAVMSVPWSATDFIQMTGRINRMGGKSTPRYHVVYCPGTVEEQVMKHLRHKLTDILRLSDSSANTPFLSVLGA